MIERIKIPRLYDRSQPSRHTFYVFLNLHIRMLRIWIEDGHEDLILGRRGCFGALRHGRRLLMLCVGNGCKPYRGGLGDLRDGCENEMC